METLYHQTNRLIQETQEYFQQLENNRGDQDVIEKNIQDNITAVNK